MAERETPVYIKIPGHGHDDGQGSGNWDRHRPKEKERIKTEIDHHPCTSDGTELEKSRYKSEFIIGQTFDMFQIIQLFFQVEFALTESTICEMDGNFPNIFASAFNE